MTKRAVIIKDKYMLLQIIYDFAEVACKYISRWEKKKKPNWENKIGTLLFILSFCNFHQ